MDQTIKVALRNVNSSDLLNNRTVYEFGMFTGDSMRFIINRTKKNPFSYIGFDSFEGFPEEKNDSHNYEGWQKGLYSAKDTLLKSPNIIASELQKELRQLKRDNNIFVENTWFSNITFNANTMKKAIFVNMDCCTYTSTCEAFDFLFKNKLVDHHTIFRFDDWGGTPEFLGGESKAMLDKCKEYNFDWSITLKRNYGGPHAKVLAKLTPKSSSTIKELSTSIKDISIKNTPILVDTTNIQKCVDSEKPIEAAKEADIPKDIKIQVPREPLVENDIYLSFIVSGRNDDYGGNYIYRLQNFISSIQIMSDHYKLKTQTIITEWNPILTNPPLKDVIHSDSKYNKVTIITVPFEFHKTLPNKSNVPIHDYVGKNVGIVRSEGEFILVCSGDLIFSKDLFNFFKSGSMKPGDIYRNTRIDFKKFTDERISAKNFDWFIKNVQQKHTGSNTFDNSRQGISVGNNIPIINKYFCNKSGEYTNGCGDFLLMSKKDWMEIKGCVSDSNYFSHLDSATLHKAMRKFKKRQMILHPKFSIFHMDHGRPHVGKDRRQPSVNYNVETISDWGYSAENFKTYHTSYTKECKYNCVIISTFKPFLPDFVIEQTNALHSWKKLRCNPKIVIVGDDEGVEDFCKKENVINHKKVKKNSYGTPLVGDIFQKGWHYAKEDDICIFVNGDIILTDSLCDSLDKFVEEFPDYKTKTYMITSRRINWFNFKSIDFNNENWENTITHDFEGKLEAPSGVDIFIHRKNTIKNFPESAIAKTGYDTWILAYGVKKMQISIDATNIIKMYHQYGKWYQDKSPCERGTKTQEIKQNRNIVQRSMGSFNGHGHINNCKIKW